MSQTIARLKRQIGSANDLQSVVRTMKAMAASNVVQYESAVDALAEIIHNPTRKRGIQGKSLAYASGYEKAVCVFDL